MNENRRFASLKSSLDFDTYMSGEPSSALNSSPTKTDESNTQVLSTPTSFSSKENKATASATPPVQRGGGGEASPQDQPKDKKTDVVKKQRRSARVLQHDPIVAPGFGTRKDLQRLARELSSDSVTFPVKAVEEMMKSRGRGIRRGGGDDSEAQDDSTAPAVSSAWADFMMEEGVQDAVMSGSNNGDKGKAEASSRGGDSTAKKRSYDTSAIAMVDKKPKKHDGGILVQAGTLDSTLVGRSKTKLQELYDLTVPTRIMGSSILIKSVVTSCTAVHSIAIDTNGRAYGWGRNEHSALGSHLPEAVVLPTRLKLASEVDEDDRVVSAAVGKGHTMLLMEDSAVYAVGWNKAGQCGVRTSTEVIPNFRKCVFEIPDVTIVQVRFLQKSAEGFETRYVLSRKSNTFVRVVLVRSRVAKTFLSPWTRTVMCTVLEALSLGSWEMVRLVNTLSRPTNSPLPIATSGLAGQPFATPPMNVCIATMTKPRSSLLAEKRLMFALLPLLVVSITLWLWRLQAISSQGFSLGAVVTMVVLDTVCKPMSIILAILGLCTMLLPRVQMCEFLLVHNVHCCKLRTGTSTIGKQFFGCVGFYAT